jgi:hypothetical protein
VCYKEQIVAGFKAGDKPVPMDLLKAICQTSKLLKITIRDGYSVMN